MTMHPRGRGAATAAAGSYLLISDKTGTRVCMDRLTREHRRVSSYAANAVEDDFYARACLPIEPARPYYRQSSCFRSYLKKITRELNKIYPICKLKFLS